MLIYNQNHKNLVLFEYRLAFLGTTVPSTYWECCGVIIFLSRGCKTKLHPAEENTTKSGGKTTAWVRFACYEPDSISLPPFTTSAQVFETNSIPGLLKHARDYTNILTGGHDPGK